MSELVEVRLPDGAQVWAQVTDTGGPSDVGLGDRLRDVERFTETLQGVAGNVRRAVDAVAPDEVAVEFGIELAANGNGLVAALAGVSGKAAIKVTLTWKRADRSASAPPGSG